MRFLMIGLVCFAAGIMPAHAQTDQRPAPFRDIQKEIDAGMPPFIGLSREAAEVMFDRQNYVTDKAAQQLRLRQDGTLPDNKFIIGGRFLGQSMYERSNTDGKFPILSRLPPAHTKKNSATVNIVQDASVNFTATLPYITAFAQGEYSESVYPGQSRQQWRKYFVTIGDLDVFPVYLTAGKKTVSFGDMSSYAPFTHSHNAHYFWAQNDDDPLFELGYFDNGLHATATLIKNDRGLRVLNAPQNEEGYENFAANISKKFMMGNGHSLKLGAGFLRGTIYDSNMAHHPPALGFQDRDWSGAWNTNATYSTGKIDLMAEFTRTLEDWQATDAHVHALTLQGRYLDYIWKIPTIYSLMYSQGIQGEDGDEWERMDQTVAGIELKVHPNASIGFEYLLNSGFVPLIQPLRTADDGVVSHTFIAGTKITF